MGTSYNPSIVKSNLVAHYDAVNKKSYIGSGSNWISLTRDKSAATLYNSPTYSNGAIVFNGTSQYGILGLAADSRFIFASNDFSIDVWVNHSSTTGSQNYYRTQQTPSSTNASFGFRQTGGTIEFFYYTAAGAQILYMSSASVVNASIWQNFTLTRVGSTFSIYKNSNFVTSSTNATAVANPIGDNWIGAYAYGPAEYLNGSMANIKIYNGLGLTANQVRQNYNANKARFGLT